MQRYVTRKVKQWQDVRRHVRLVSPAEATPIFSGRHEWAGINVNLRCMQILKRAMPRSWVRITINDGIYTSWSCLLTCLQCQQSHAQALCLRRRGLRQRMPPFREVSTSCMLSPLMRDPQSLNTFFFTGTGISTGKNSRLSRHWISRSQCSVA
jgi:hypothetical protein